MTLITRATQLAFTLSKSDSTSSIIEQPQRLSVCRGSRLINFVKHPQLPWPRVRSSCNAETCELLTTYSRFSVDTTSMRYLVGPQRPSAAVSIRGVLPLESSYNKWKPTQKSYPILIISSVSRISFILYSIIFWDDAQVLDYNSQCYELQA